MYRLILDVRQKIDMVFKVGGMSYGELSDALAYAGRAEVDFSASNWKRVERMMALLQRGFSKPGSLASSFAFVRLLPCIVILRFVSRQVSSLVLFRMIRIAWGDDVDVSARPLDDGSIRAVVVRRRHP